MRKRNEHSGASLAESQSLAGGSTASAPSGSADHTAALTDACRLRLHAVIRRFHGEVGSPLAAMGLRLELLKGQADIDPSVAQSLHGIAEDLGKVVDTVRESVRELKELEKSVTKGV